MLHNFLLLLLLFLHEIIIVPRARQLSQAALPVLLVVGVVWKVNGRPPTSTPVEPKLVGDRAENW